MIIADTILSPVREAIRTRDEKKIAATVYRPVKEGDKLVVIGPSALETQDCYHSLAMFFAGQGMITLTYDYRGMGYSVFGDTTGCCLHHWGNFDLDAVLRYAKNNFPGKEIIFLAHGLSGELLGLAAASQYINRIVLINAVLSCSRLWPLRDRVKLFLIKQYRLLLARVARFVPHRLFSTPPLPAGVICEWLRWCNNNRGLFDAFPDNNYRKLQVPLLAISFSDDWHAPVKAVSVLLRHFDSADINWIHAIPRDYNLPYSGHSGFFDAACKKTFWHPLLLWFSGTPFPGNSVNSCCKPAGTS